MRKLIIAVLCLMVCLSACGSNSYNLESSVETNGLATLSDTIDNGILSNTKSSMNYKATTQANEQNNSNSLNNNQESISTNAKMIYTGNVYINTTKINDIAQYIKELVSNVNGYIEDYEQSDSNVHIVARIPSESYNDILYNKDIEDGNVVERRSSARDVTLECSDTESQLATLRIEEERLLNYLKQANNISDMLTIESRLQSVRNEIETVSRRLKVLDNRVSYSTISFSISSTFDNFPEQSTTFWQRLVRKVQEAGYGFLTMSEGIIFGIIKLLPALFWLGLIGFVICSILKRIVRNKNKAHKSKLFNSTINKIKSSNKKDNSNTKENKQE